MLFEEGDAALLKKWIVKRLEDISDADSDVLADYVLALLRHEGGEPEVKKFCIDQLDDFLREHTRNFVEDVFVALRTKSFLSVNSTLAGSAAGLSIVVPSAPTSPTKPTAEEPESLEQQGQEQVPEKADGEIAEQPGAGQNRGQYINSFSQGYNQNNNNREGERGQKRSYHDRDRDGGRDPQYGPNSMGGRGFKAPRRGANDRGGGNGGRWNGNIGRGGPNRDMGPSPMMPFANPFPTPGLGQPVIQPAFPWPEDPMTALLAMQAAAGWTGMPGFPPIPTAAGGKDAASSAQRKPVERKVGERCKDYDEKGYCMQGDMCPYEHGTDHIVIAGQDQAANDEYDPNNSQLFPVQTTTTNGSVDRNSINNRGNGDRGRGGRGGGRGGRGGAGGTRGGRSEISGTGPNYDKSNTTLVVEHIPEDKLNETAIKGFFSTFGTVTEVVVQHQRKLATVKFEKWDMAKKAYDSPAPIFDNRFVKVFWFKPEQAARIAGTSPAPGAPGGVRAAVSPPPQLSKLADEGEIDMEEFKRKSEEAQRAHEEKMARKKAHEERLKELEKKKEELLRMEQEQRRILMEKLAKRKAAVAKAKEGSPAAGVKEGSPAMEAGVNGKSKEGTPGAQSPPAASSTTLAKETPPSSTPAASDAETEALRAQLEALEAEAKFLGIDQTASDASTSYRGRGGFRGRAVFRGAALGRGRGLGSPYVSPSIGKPYVPGYRGRGSVLAARGRGGAMRLDNRTRKVAVGGVDGGGERNEALRQYLLGIGEFESIEPHPDKEDTQIVTFKDRATAEKFVHAGPHIPNIGKVDMAWVNPTTNISSSAVSTANATSATSVTSATTTTARTTTTGKDGITSSTQDLKHEDIVSGHGAENGKLGVEDYDLADDDESRWLAE
ncbi:hypothetical protein BDZ91DRAFT_369450 [Kalaharituber pfeilii]|nr:hypothetical protein BDZ91DRAFT_369450 [Kalaharituber pfeilii]